MGLVWFFVVPSLSYFSAISSAPYQFVADLDKKRKAPGEGASEAERSAAQRQGADLPRARRNAGGAREAQGLVSTFVCRLCWAENVRGGVGLGRWGFFAVRACVSSRIPAQHGPCQSLSGAT